MYGIPILIIIQSTMSKWKKIKEIEIVRKREKLNACPEQGVEGEGMVGNVHW